MSPLIGIIMRSSESATGKSTQVVYDDIIKSIINSGGTPVGIPYKHVKKYLKICSGFVMQGGDEFNQIDMLNINLLKEYDIPLLGICLGMQEMAYISSGVIKDIPNHKNKTHPITIVKDSLLYKIVDTDKMIVNSRHISAITKTNLKVSSYSLDNIIESVEDPTCKFFLGIQWHPENLYDDGVNKKIFDYFIKVCQD